MMIKKNSPYLPNRFREEKKKERGQILVHQPWQNVFKVVPRLSMLVQPHCSNGIVPMGPVSLAGWQVSIFHKTEPFLQSLLSPALLKLKWRYSEVTSVIVPFSTSAPPVDLKLSAPWKTRKAQCFMRFCSMSSHFIQCCKNMCLDTFKVMFSSTLHCKEENMHLQSCPLHAYSDARQTLLFLGQFAWDRAYSWLTSR